MSNITGGVIIVFYIVAIIINVGLLYWVQKQELGQNGRLFSFSVLMMIGWVSTIGIFNIFPINSITFFIWHLTFIFVWGTAIGWFIFAIYYTGLEHYFTLKYQITLSITIIIIIILTLTNPLHNLIWSSYTIVEIGNIETLVASVTMLHNVILFIGYILTLSTAVILLGMMMRSKRVTRQQTFILASTFIVSTGVHFIQFLIPVNIRLDVVAVTIIGVGISYTLLRKGLLKLEPVSRNDVITTVDEGIIVVNNNNVIIDYNVLAQKIFPELEDSIGEQIQSVLPKIIKTEHGKNNEIQFSDKVTVNKNNKIKKYLLNKTEVRKNNKTRAYTLSLRDITELEQYATDLERQTEQLEEFASFVSHDMRNPITVAQTYLDDVQNDSNDERIETSIEALERIDEMIDNSLELVKKGQAVQEVNEHSLSDIITESWTMTNTQNATLTNNVPNNIIIRCDDIRLQSLFENLFRNSVEHAGSDVTVTVGLLENNTGFYVEDTGPGIPSDKRDKVFEKGFTSDDDGTGFGLAIVKSITVSHGWEIRVEESSTGGAKFVVVVDEMMYTK